MAVIQNVCNRFPDTVCIGSPLRDLNSFPPIQGIVPDIVGQASPLSNIDQTLSGLIRHTVTVN